MSVISVKNISKCYEGQRVLKGTSLTVEEGEMVLLKGRSGAGKSTLLNICSDLEMPDTGEVYWNERDIKSIDEREKKKIVREDIGYIFQDYNLFEEMTVFDNLDIYLGLVSNMDAKQRIQKIEEVLSKLGLLEKMMSKAKLLSGGERQRVALARALVKNKKIIFADEPSANIDDYNVEIMRNIFKNLKERGTALLIVTHDEVFDDMADHIYELAGGEIK